MAYKGIFLITLLAGVSLATEVPSSHPQETQYDFMSALEKGRNLFATLATVGGNQTLTISVASLTALLLVGVVILAVAVAVAVVASREGVAASSYAHPTEYEGAVETIHRLYNAAAAKYKYQ
ncbi:uncharacterized protein [Cherax quadricarinatus]|uniref:uncharacterized protein n=1 Tax=Cherax quadricarinatus TaxID=27406 RepID=UPI00387E451E